MIDTEVLKEATYIGIDVNIKGLGLAVFAAEKVHLEFFDMIPWSPDEYDTTNMTTIWSLSCIQLLESVHEKIDSDRKTILVVEDPTAMGSFHTTKDGRVTSSWQTASILDKLVGMLSVIAIQYKWKVLTPSSVMWKKRVIGDGKAKKPAIQSHMYNVIYGREGEIANHHVADSAALAYYGYLEDRYGKAKDTT